MTLGWQLIDPTTLPDTLFHYTNAAGLSGILNPTWPSWVKPPKVGGSAVLQASDVRYMNDTGEFRFGAKLMVRELRKFAEQIPDLAETYREVADRIEPGLFESTRHLRLFAACFCARGDLLSQWRGYAQGVGGYAIGFNRDALYSRAIALYDRGPMLQPIGPQLRMIKVVYGEGAALDEIQRFIVDIHAKWTNGQTFTVAGGKPSVEWLLGRVYEFLAMFKHEAFEEEREFRLVGTVDPSHPHRIPTRATTAGLVPYLNMAVNLPDEPGAAGPELPTITTVIVGPGPDQDGQIAAVRDLLTTAGYANVDVFPSGAPYRG